MRILFAGTPEFARIALERLLAAGFEIALVLSQPDRPAGRGLKLQASPVKQLAQQHGMQVLQPRGLRLDGKYPEDAHAAQAVIEAAQADAMVVAAYGLILPQWALDAPRLGCMNIHASLLPRWRGAAPIHRAIEAGDGETGITIMQMDAGLDTGAMLLVEKLAIDVRDTTGSLHDRLAPLGGRLIVEALELAACGGLAPVAQPQAGVTYAQKVEKQEALIDWSQPADAIARRIRAFNPAPGAQTVMRGETLKAWNATAAAGQAPQGAPPGAVIAVAPDRVSVAAGSGIVALTELQRAGAKRLALAEFLRGFEVYPGMLFAKPAS